MFVRSMAPPVSSVQVTLNRTDATYKTDNPYRFPASLCAIILNSGKCSKFSTKWYCPIKMTQGQLKILVLLQPVSQFRICESTSKQMHLLWWVVADKIDSFGPNLSPHIHVVTQVDGTANPAAGCPDQLQKEWQDRQWNTNLTDCTSLNHLGLQNYSGYLCVMSTNWARASEGAVGITLLWVREWVVLHFIIPGLHMERGWTIPGEMSNLWRQCSK